MSRSLLSAAFAVALFALIAAPASAQVPSGVEYSAALTLTDLPTTTVLSADTQAVVPFKLVFTVSNLVCLGNGATFTANVMAAATGNGTGNATVAVNQPVVTFTVPIGQGLAQAYTQTVDNFLTVRPVNGTADAEAIEATIDISAELASIAGCETATCCGSAPAVAEAAFKTRFTAPAGGFGGPSGEVVPGLGVPAMLAVVVAAVIVLRRKA